MSMYTVRLERGSDGWWFAKVQGVEGCHTQGRSISQAMTRIRKCLALVLGRPKAARAEFTQEIILPPSLESLRGKLREAEERAEELQRKKAEAAAKALQGFARAGFSTRDMGTCFRISHQRVHQRAAIVGPVKVSAAFARGAGLRTARG